MTDGDPEVNIDRMIVELDALASRSDAPAPERHARPLHGRRPGGTGLDRAALPPMPGSRSARIRSATPSRWEGLEPDMPPVGTGSHIDAIPHSGRFDGTVGVLGGLEAIAHLRRWGSGRRDRSSS